MRPFWSDRRREAAFPEEEALRRQRRRLLRNALIRIAVLAFVIYHVLGEAGPWTAGALGLLFLCFELYEQQVRRLSRIGEEMKRIAEELRRRLVH